MSDATQTAESLEPESEEQLENQRIGRRLRALRTERGMTILEMAAKAGVSAGSISQIERGATNPSISTLQKLRVALGVTLWSFLAFTLDALAIAAQALTGRSLGAGDVAGTRATTSLVIRWGWRTGFATGVLLEHFEGREEAAALQKLASHAMPGDEARWRDEFLDTMAQLDRQVLQQRVDELQAKQREVGLDDADKAELRSLLAARVR